MAARRSDVISWLLDGDPAIRWQTLRDLTGEPFSQARAKVLEQGWGAKLLSKREPSGHWGGGAYSPKWISTTYTLLEFRHLGPPHGHPALTSACKLLLDCGFSRDGGFNMWRRAVSETCVTGMAVAVSSALGLRDDRLPAMVEFLLREQMPDGGWNCQKCEGATHGSFHTTISVLEALLDYDAARGRPATDESQRRGREFLLRHHLYRSHRTGEVVDDRMTRFAFPPRWHYDVLRALDYFRSADAERDERLQEAIALVEKRRGADGRWTLPAPFSGRVHFRMEEAGTPSRWNTLRCLRVLRWWER